MIPLIVVEGPRAQFENAIGDVRARGWAVIEGWPSHSAGPHSAGPRSPRPAGASERAGDAPPPGGVPVFAGVVVSPADAGAAVAAVIAGAGIVAHGSADARVLGALCDDLRHLGRLDHRVGESRVVLTGEERELLDLLLDGCTVAAAADRLYLSRRSAVRRLTTLRERFGVGTSIELLAAYRERRDSVPLAPSSS